MLASALKSASNNYLTEVIMFDLIYQEIVAMDAKPKDENGKSVSLNLDPKGDIDRILQLKTILFQIISIPLLS